MILHLSHIVLTEGRTFMTPYPFGIVRSIYTPSRRCEVSPVISTHPGVSTARLQDSRYLYRYVIRPRDRSYGESSTTTLSPGSIRM